MTSTNTSSAAVKRLRDRMGACTRASTSPGGMPRLRAASSRLGLIFASPASTVCSAIDMKRTRYAYTRTMIVPLSHSFGALPNWPASQLDSQRSNCVTGAITPTAITTPGIAYPRPAARLDAAAIGPGRNRAA